MVQSRPMQLADIRHLIIDMDGVLWRGKEPLPGLPEFFGTLRRLGIKFILATNNASKTPAQYVAKLAGFGAQVQPEEILTSAEAAALHLAQTAPRGAPIFVIGEDGVKEALAQNGFAIANPGPTPPDLVPGANGARLADYVVVGWDNALDWNKLSAACLLIRAGAHFIGANPDVTYPSERGVVPGNGATLAYLQTATGIAPQIIGKPEPIMYRLALARLGGTPEDTAALGDRLETDILGAKRAGLPSILVLSGVTSREALAASDYKPEWVFADIAALTQTLAQHASHR